VERAVENGREAGAWAWPSAVVGAVVLAALTVAVVRDGGPLPGELRVVRWWQSVGEPVPTLAEFVRVTTSTEACLAVSLLPAAWLVRRHGRGAAPAILIVLCSTLVVQPLFKELVDRPRPTADQVDVRAEHTSTSFPSGHSLSTAATWGASSLVAWRARRRVWAAALAMPVALTGLSSSVQGVHWPSDALAGTIVGGFAAVWISRIVARAGERRD
jgi:membrane-associated phospholipid phosphatase